ncbi:hypothetical protein HR12_40575 [Microbacterium sp. SUBG005]|nr:hypothetical protein HR12_40575 [Microbacterium sp. SUBG005]
MRRALALAESALAAAEDCVRSPTADSILRMASGPQRPAVLIGLGVAFLLVGLLGLALFLGDPMGATGRGIPMWLALPVVWVGGIAFIEYGRYWRVRGRSSR